MPRPLPGCRETRQRLPNRTVYQFISNHYVTFHYSAFLIVECPWFEKNTVRSGELSDVVQPRTHGYVVQMIFQSSKRDGEFDRIPEHAPGVTGSGAIPEINGAPECLEGRGIAPLQLAHGVFELLRALRHHRFEVPPVVLYFSFKLFFLERTSQAG